MVLTEQEKLEYEKFRAEITALEGYIKENQNSLTLTAARFAELEAKTVAETLPAALAQGDGDPVIHVPIPKGTKRDGEGGLVYCNCNAVGGLHEHTANGIEAR